MLELKSVSKHFGGAEVVSDISLGVERGSIVGLIGPNGAGKTTLFNLVAGALRPSQGEIHLAGANITREAPYRRMARGLGRTFQIPRPFAEMTLIENMLTAAQSQSGERLFANWLTPGKVGAEERANAERAMAHLEFLGLARLAREPARILSGGQRKLLELGRGVTFLIIEHNMDLIARLCRHVFVLAAGRMLFEGTPRAAITDPHVIEAYLGTGTP
jgi:branched-chain amino acid transport system ATP-binding protein